MFWEEIIFDEATNIGKGVSATEACYALQRVCCTLVTSASLENNSMNWYAFLRIMRRDYASIFMSASARAEAKMMYPNNSMRP